MYRSIHIKYIFLLSVMVFASVKTHADVLDIDTIMSPYDMSELVITATRTPRSFKDTPVLTRLITRKDIEQADAPMFAQFIASQVQTFQLGMPPRLIPRKLKLIPSRVAALIPGIAACNWSAYWLIAPAG